MTSTSATSSRYLVSKIFFLLASCGAAYLLFATIKNGPVAGCGGGSSCDTVLKSRWAYLLPGVPVTAPALFTYLVLLYGLFFKPDSDTFIGVFLIGSLMVIGAAIWFTGIQAFVLKTFCPWCMATHAAGSIAAVALILALRPIQRGLVPLAVVGAAMSLAMLAAAQVFMPQSTTKDSDLGAEGLSGAGAVIELFGEKLDLTHIPYHGDPASAKRMVVMFDYTCSSCRRIHSYLHRAEERFGKDQYLLVMLPTPLNPDCNRHFEEKMSDHRNACLFATMALAIWSVDHEKFYEFDRWLVETGTSSNPPDAAAARAKAEELMGKEVLAAAMEEAHISANITKICKIWADIKSRTGMLAMPKILWGNGGIKEGAVDSEFQLFDAMQEKLGLKRIN
jgi:uncharacterized membrane protein